MLVISQNSFIVALICISACLSFTIWCHIACLLGYESWDTAFLSLFELPLIAFYFSFIKGSRLAAAGIGITMAATAALWAYYLHHIIIEQLNNGTHAEHALPIILVSLYVLVKMVMAYTCLLSPKFRTVLKTIQQETADLRMT
jgi:hypothetical protein